MQWVLVLGFLNFFVSPNLACLTNPFRVADSKDYPDRPKLINGVTQGFKVVNRQPGLEDHQSRSSNPQIVVDKRPFLNIPQMQNKQSGARLSVDINRWRNGTKRLITVKNQGIENEFVKMSAFNADGQIVPMNPSEFYLSGGSSTDIPLILVPNIGSPKNPLAASSEALELITVQARGKRDSVKRSFYFGDNQQFEPFCFDKDVTGTCRYRTDPDECFRWEWTAYATILNQGGGQKITSIPEGLYLSQGEHGRVRVYLKISCCTPVVQFISNDPYYQSNSCVVDVRELQALHPGEIAAIVVAIVAFIIIILVVIFLCVRKRRKENIAVKMLPHNRTRSREVIARQ